MAAQDEFLSELSQRYGVKVGETDAANLAGKNPEDVAKFKTDLETQYRQRGETRSGQSSDDAPAQQYSTPSQAWNQAPTDPYPSWYRGLMEKSLAMQEQQRAETKQKADALYGQLDARASQGLTVNANDPIIKGQVDAFSAQGERSRRGYLSDVAERSGPYANLRGEQRMTAEKLGQGTSAFQAELLGRELGSRRDEISQALQMQGGLLSGDQQRGLTERLSSYDQAIKEAGVGLQGRDIDLRGQLGFAGLDLQRDLGFAGIGLQRELGQGGLGLQRRGQDMSMDQFLRDLALREWQAGDNSDYRWQTGV